MPSPLFYAVRRLTRGPRGALLKVEVIRPAITSRGRAAFQARDLSKADPLHEYDAVGVTVKYGRFHVSSTVATFRSGSGGHALRAVGE